MMRPSLRPRFGRNFLTAFIQRHLGEAFFILGLIALAASQIWLPSWLLILLGLICFFLAGYLYFYVDVKSGVSAQGAKAANDYLVGPQGNAAYHHATQHDLQETSLNQSISSQMQWAQASEALRADHPAARMRHLQYALSSETLLLALDDPALLLGQGAELLEINEAALRLFPRLQKGSPLSYGLRNPALLQAVEAYLSGESDGTPREVAHSERVPVLKNYIFTLKPIAREGMQGRGIEGRGADQNEKRQKPNVKPSHILISIRDISAERRLESLRSEFIANVSHELKTPLASISGFIETLEGAARHDPAAQKRFLSIMKGQTMRMQRLIDDLLSLSRIELKQHIRPTGALSGARLISEVCEALSPLARERHVEIIQTFEDERARDVGRDEYATHAPLIIGDRDELWRVFENLIENALKYGAPNDAQKNTLARIEISQTESRDHMHYTIRDFGKGIAEEHLSRLTERFYRADAHESREQGGTGLGLALVKHILNRHGGKLLVESQLGLGAAFTVVLPKQNTVD